MIEKISKAAEKVAVNASRRMFFGWIGEKAVAVTALLVTPLTAQACARRRRRGATGPYVACKWGGDWYTPGSWIGVYENGVCFKHYCQPDGSWRKDGFC